MELEDFAQPEVGVAVAVTAIATSPSIRKTLRKGAAYGLAGVLLAGDAAHRFVNAAVRGARTAGNSLHATSSADGAASTTHKVKIDAPAAQTGPEVAEGA